MSLLVNSEEPSKLIGDVWVVFVEGGCHNDLVVFKPLVMIADEPGFQDGGFEVGDIAFGTDAVVDGGDETGGIIGAEEDGADERPAEEGWDAIGFAG